MYPRFVFNTTGKQHRLRISYFISHKKREDIQFMRIRISGLLSAVIFFVLQGNLFAQLHWDMAKAGDIGKVLTIRDQEKVHNENLPYRLDTLLPQIMRREGIDMWLVLNLEYNEDPVYMSLVKRPAFNARRLSILVFHDDPEQGFKKLNASWWGKWS